MEAKKLGCLLNRERKFLQHEEKLHSLMEAGKAKPAWLLVVAGKACCQLLSQGRWCSDFYGCFWRWGER